MKAAEVEALRFLITAVFRQSGSKAMSEMELMRAMAFDLRWFAPKDARRVAEGLARTGLVARTEDGGLEPTFSIADVSVPLTFRPTEGLVAAIPREGDVVSVAPSAPERPSRRAVADATSQAPPEGSDGRDADPDEQGAPEAASSADPIAETRSPDSGGHEEVTVASLLDALAKASSESVPTWVERMNVAVQQADDLLTPEAALLLAAAGRGLDVSPWVGPVKAGLGALRA